MSQHRWSGWPGAICLDCGEEDQNEWCLAVHMDGLICTEGHMQCEEHPLRGCTEHVNGPCLHPGERLYDPYGKALEAQVERHNEKLKERRCEWSINPFAMGDEDEQCSNPGRPEWFRRKTDGVVRESFRCPEHSRMTNEAWEHETPQG